MKRTRKALSVLLTLAMIIGLLLPMGAPAMAATDNYVSTIPTVDSSSDEVQDLGTVYITEDSDRTDDIQNNTSFIVTLPSGVKWDSSTTVSATYYNGSWKTMTGVTATISSDQSLMVKINADATELSYKNQIRIVPKVKFDGFGNGDIKLTIDAMDSGVSSGEILVARGSDSDATSVALSTEAISQSSAQEGGVIRITETNAANFSNGGKIKLTLPEDFTWNSDMDTNPGKYITTSAQGVTFADADVVVDGKEMTIDLEAHKSDFDNKVREVIEIKPLIDVDSDAAYGDVTVDVEGINGASIEDATLTIAKYADYGVTISAKTVEEVIAGEKDQELGKLVIEENAPGSLVDGRPIYVEFNSSVVKFATNNNGDSWYDQGTITKKAGDLDLINATITDSNKIQFTVKASKTAGKIEIPFKHVNIAPDATGDVVATVSGSAGAKGEVVVAKVVPSVTAAVDSVVDAKLGVQGQAVSDLTITEGKKGGLKKGTLLVELPDGVSFTGTPKAEVTAGNVDIDEDSAKVESTSGAYNNQLKITVNGKSSQPSTIKISGIKLSVNRSVATGEIVAKIKGTAVAETSYDANTLKENAKKSKSDFYFDTTTAAKVVLANVVNAAPEAGSVSFNIGSNVYTVNGAMKVMDVAPYIKDGRTYVPVKYLALALGVSEDNIKYENGVVTLVKGDVTLKLTIGDKNLDNNGTVTAMDVAPEINNGRTMLPARFVAEAFGAQVGYANGTVVISY